MTAEQVLIEELPFMEPLECDGACRVLRYRLKKEGIAHSCFLGELYYMGKRCSGLHFWIRLQDGRVMDVKAQKWCGGDAPNGIFSLINFPDYEYRVKEEIDLWVNEFAYDVLRNYMVR